MSPGEGGRRVTCPSCKHTDLRAGFPEFAAVSPHLRQCPKCQRLIGEGQFAIAVAITDLGAPIDLLGSDGSGLYVPQYAVWGTTPDDYKVVVLETSDDLPSLRYKYRVPLTDIIQTAGG